MNAKITELVFILDRSGSMGGLEGDTIGGFNGMIEKQRKDIKKRGDHDEKVNITTVLFDDQVELIHDRFDIDIVEPLTDDDYYVRGCTALLDAVGSTILKVSNIQKRLPEDMRAGKVIFVITTDGHENSSREYSYSQIKSMIEQKKEEGWEFLFLGANIDAVETAAQYGIDEDRAVNFHADKEGTTLNFKVLSKAIGSVRCGAPLSSRWKQEIDQDFQTRK